MTRSLHSWRARKAGGYVEVDPRVNLQLISPARISPSGHVDRGPRARSTACVDPLEVEIPRNQGRRKPLNGIGFCIRMENPGGTKAYTVPGHGSLQPVLAKTVGCPPAGVIFTLPLRIHICMLAAT